MPAWLIPALLAGGQALSSMGQQRAQNAQQRQADQGLQLTRERVQMDNLQQQRQNALQDQQAAAVNPMRQQLFGALASRLGLPSGSLGFNVAPQAVAQQRARAVPAQAAAQTQAAATTGANVAGLQSTIEQLKMQMQGNIPTWQRASYQQMIDQLQRRIGVTQ
jgi:hypothetical protein